MKVKLIILGLIALVAINVQAYEPDSSTLAYDTAVCQDAVNDLGDTVSGQLVDYLFFKWNRDVNQYTTPELIEFCSFYGRYIQVYGDTIKMLCTVTHGTPARLANMALTNNRQSDVLRFAETLSYFIDYDESGFNISALVDSTVYGRSVKSKGRVVIGKLVYVSGGGSQTEKYGLIISGDNSYKCNLFTIKPY